MRIGVIGNTRGNVDLVNVIADKYLLDYILSVGNFGLHYRNTFKGKYDNNFCDYIEGRKKFNIPVVAVRGVTDNIDLVSRLTDSKIIIDNFTLLNDGSLLAITDNIKSDITGNSFIVGGVGGSYSPKHYDKDKLFGGEKRHFIRKDIVKLQALGKKLETGISILMMHDLIGSGTKKEIIYSDETYRILSDCRPIYCFVNKYNWWGCSKIPGTTMIILPYADVGFAILDTKEWDVDGITFGDKN